MGHNARCPNRHKLVSKAGKSSPHSIHRDRSPSLVWKLSPPRNTARAKQFTAAVVRRCAHFLWGVCLCVSESRVEEEKRTLPPIHRFKEVTSNKIHTQSPSSRARLVSPVELVGVGPDGSSSGCSPWNWMLSTGFSSVLAICFLSFSRSFV